MPGRAESVSWSLGPGDSRFARLALYASESAFGGSAVAVLLGLTGVDFGASPIVLASAAVGFVAALRLVRTWDDLVDQFEVVEREWDAVRRWRWVLAGTAVAAFLVADAAALGRPPYQLAVGFLVAATVFRGGGWFLCSSGRVDPATLTLSYDDRYEADLSRLVRAHLITAGDVTLVWLTFERDYVTDVPVLYVLPADVTDRIRPVFEESIVDGQQPTNEPSPIESQ